MNFVGANSNKDKRPLHGVVPAANLLYISQAVL
jgi:hypothetical protein